MHATATREERALSRPAARRFGLVLFALACLLVAVSVAALTLIRFSPRYVEWRGLRVAQRFSRCDCHRAFDSLQQLHDPWAKIESTTNQVIAWRLLFPLVWHYGHLPSELYLGMPWLGCLLTLWLVAWLNRHRLRDWPDTLLSTATFAALPWFFVSTGWLTYFDSWLVLCFLVTAFVRWRPALALACLAAPWIDERFLFGLPLAIAARAITHRQDEARLSRAFYLDAAIVVAASFPYPTIRGLAWLGGDPSTDDYVRRHWQAVQNVPVSFFLMGLWSKNFWMPSYNVGWLHFAACT